MTVDHSYDDVLKDTTPLFLRHNEYVKRLRNEAWFQLRKPWYAKVGAVPRFYWDGWDTKLVVFDQDAVDGPGFVDDVTRFVDRCGAHVGFLGGVAHELGHAAGLDHVEGLAGWFDVMGAPSLRVHDRHRLLPLARDWVKKQGLGRLT